MTPLVSKMRKTGKVSATPVPRKGGHPYAVHWATEEIRRAGAGKVFVRTDPEAALRKLMESVQLNGIHWYLRENSAVGWHAGEAENAVGMLSEGEYDYFK